MVVFGLVNLTVGVAVGVWMQRERVSGARTRALPPQQIENGWPARGGAPSPPQALVNPSEGSQPGSESLEAGLDDRDVAGLGKVDALISGAFDSQVWGQDEVTAFRVLTRGLSGRGRLEAWRRLSAAIDTHRFRVTVHGMPL
jgi:hypothetical protein